MPGALANISMHGICSCSRRAQTGSPPGQTLITLTSQLLSMMSAMHNGTQWRVAHVSMYTDFIPALRASYIRCTRLHMHKWLTAGSRFAHQLVAYPIRIPDRVMLGRVLLQIEKTLFNMPMSDTFLAMTPALQEHMVML